MYELAVAQVLFLSIMIYMLRVIIESKAALEMPMVNRIIITIKHQNVGIINHVTVLYQAAVRYTGMAASCCGC